jgi:hypothetical protein
MSRKKPLVSRAKAVATTTTPPEPFSATVGVEFKPVPFPRLVVGPLASSGERIDITRYVIELIAKEIWKRQEGNDVLNWIEAERLLGEALAQVSPADKRPESSPTVPASRRHGR